MIVVEGQPYYQSTGRNSGCASIWFPFIMIKGNRPIDKLKIPAMYKPSFYNQDKKPTYIIKILRHYLQTEVDILPHDKEDRIIKNRNPLKTTLITAARLTGPLFPESTLIKAKLNAEEIELARTPLVIEDSPIFSLQDPDKINDWLMNQGAPKILSEIVVQQEEPEEEIDIVSIDKYDNKKSRFATSSLSFVSSLGQKDKTEKKSRHKPYARDSFIADGS